MGAIISDLHCGAFPADIWYNELSKGFLKKISKAPILDFIIISGDFFDTKISVNSQYAKMGLKFFTKLLKICKEKNCKLRVIKGTESHDNKQLEIFDELDEAVGCDFRIIYTVEKEWLFHDLKVLYLPEEYIDSVDEYYGEFFKDTYNLIIGHGLVDKAAFIATIQESESTHPKAAIFKTALLNKICNGPIYFGHIHKPMVVNKFRYVGSYSRWAFGEEEDKGYYMLYITPKTGKFRDEFIVNDIARRFDTVKVEVTSSIFHKSEGEIVEYMMELANTLRKDFIRLEINIPEDFPNPLLLTTMLMEFFNKYKNVKLKINNNTKLRQKKKTEEQVILLLEKFNFIFDKSKQPEEKISKFIKIQYDKNISIERIREYLTEEIKLQGGS